MTDKIPGIVLAGGLSRRMGGGDKSLLELGGEPLLLRAARRLAAGASPLAISANGDASRYAAFGLPVISDLTDDRRGPLGGILAGMRWAERTAPRARFIATAASDTPFFPEDLVSRLVAAANGTSPAIVLASSAGRIHPVFGLWPVCLAGDLAEALAAGHRKVLDWTGLHQRVIAEFLPLSLGGKPVDPFFNVNTPEEFAYAAGIQQSCSHGEIDRHLRMIKLY